MKYKNLTLPEVAAKQQQYGKNILPEEKTVPAIRIFFLQFVNPLVYVLGFIGIISLFLQKYTDIILIFSVVLVNAFMGFFQENKTQNTLAALKKLVKPNAKVLRNNERQEIEAAELVPGDIVFLAIGDRVPADGQVLEAMSFFTNEAILTGESEALEKRNGDEVFMGTIISSGRAVIRIEKTGKNTKIGKIAATLKETEQPVTTLQLRLKKLTRTLIFIAIILAAAVFLFGLATGRNSLEMLELSAVLLTAIIPEALLIVITLVLVIAMRESLKKKALIRKILAVETLGSVTVICTDKTGTLTEGKMKVVETDFVNKKNSFLTMCVCNDLSDTLEIALWDYLREQKDFDQEKIFDENTRIYEIPFGSEHKFMATVNSVFKDGEEYLVSIKGAPEVIMGMATISEEEKKDLIIKIDKWAEKGLKVLALAHKQIAKRELPEIKDKKITGFEWDGLVGLWDPPRKDVKEALLAAKESGLKIKVVTGDYYRTAIKVMKFLGIKVKPSEIMEGAELEKLSAAELKSRISDILLFSRTTPEQKLRIVGTLQELGEIVAMTGDGVNDAPALKKSNIGIVVGDASEVAKETADLILLDSNFKTIVSAVESGRLVFENIQKIILFILSNSFSEVVVIVGALIFNWPFPLTIIQILWLQLICDGPEDFILGFEPKEKETMLDGPKRIADPIFGKSSILTTIAVSLISGLISLGFFWYFGLRESNLVLGQTMAFMSLAFTSVSYIFSCRTLRKPFWKYENFWSNKGIFAVVVGSLFLAIIITYLPLTQKLLGLAPLSMYHWGLLFVNAVILISIVEIAKYLIKVDKKKKY
jgi:P-type Ca2+ transporter type 2C